MKSINFIYKKRSDSLIKFIYIVNILYKNLVL